VRKKTGEIYIAPWEKAFGRVLTPLEDFIHRQTTSAILQYASNLSIIKGSFEKCSRLFVES